MLTSLDLLIFSLDYSFSDRFVLAIQKHNRVDGWNFFFFPFEIKKSIYDIYQYPNYRNDLIELPYFFSFFEFSELSQLAPLFFLYIHT